MELKSLYFSNLVPKIDNFVEGGKCETNLIGDNLKWKKLTRNLIYNIIIIV